MMNFGTDNQATELFTLVRKFPVSNKRYLKGNKLFLDGVRVTKQLFAPPLNLQLALSELKLETPSAQNLFAKLLFSFSIQIFSTLQSFNISR